MQEPIQSDSMHRKYRPYSVVILCFNRVKYLRETLQRIVSADRASQFSISVYVDGPRSEKDVPSVKNVVELVRSISAEYPSAEMELFENVSNLGCWASKLFALNREFNQGREVVLLVEDDVWLAADALAFVVDAIPYLNEHPQVATLSLYSSNLKRSADDNFDTAKKYLDEQPKTYCEWGVRNWPFPWGIAFTGLNFSRLSALGWNGHDQRLGAILREYNLLDLFPVISRAIHVGLTSSISTVEAVIDEPFLSDVAQKSFDIDVAVSTNEAARKANKYYKTLGEIAEKQARSVQIFFEDKNALSAFKAQKGAGFKSFDVEIDAVRFLNDESKYISSIASKLYHLDVLLLIDNKELSLALEHELKKNKLVNLVS